MLLRFVHDRFISNRKLTEHKSVAVVSELGCVNLERLNNSAGFENLNLCLPSRTACTGFRCAEGMTQYDPVTRKCARYSTSMMGVSGTSCPTTQGNPMDCRFEDFVD